MSEMDEILAGYSYDEATVCETIRKRFLKRPARIAMRSCRPWINGWTTMTR